MDHCWQSYDAWIAYFDLLGFEQKLKTTRISMLQQEVNDIVKDLRAEAKEFERVLDYLFYADTFILYTKSGENEDYPGLLHASTHFMAKCIFKGTALRGAISFGQIAVGNDKRIMIGEAFLDSHQYGEDQDWLGLILTPTASHRLRELKLDPARQGFVFMERFPGKSAQDQMTRCTHIPFAVESQIFRTRFCINSKKCGCYHQKTLSQNTTIQ